MKFSPTAGTLTVKPVHQRGERRRLGHRHDRLVSQRIAVGVVPIRHAAHGVPQDLDGRLGHMFVVVGRARLPQIL